jgi:hypothetical protein
MGNFFGLKYLSGFYAIINTNNLEGTIELISHTAYV